ncbi:MAG: SET domain-containing protein [Polyangiaceae bacterium]|nr:SET domain-containing protein [Polyangiaceae bacterium]
MRNPDRVKQAKNVNSKLLQLIEVKRSLIHGRGVFARTTIRKGARIGTYEGEVTLRDGTHVLWVPMENGKYLGVHGKNELRYMNHSSRPTAEVDGIEVYARKTIKPGTEVTFHYGDEWEDVD